MMPSILITGGTGKFGRKFIEHFVHKDWRVLFTSTSRDKISELEKVFDQKNGLKGYEVDLTKKDAPTLLIAEILRTSGQINHLVNNARSLNYLAVGENGTTHRENFQSELLMDVIVPYELSMALYQAQSDALKTIINIGSQYGVVAANPALYNDYVSQSPIQYGVGKAALSHLTKELAVRFAEKRIRVNCIAYGGVEGRVDDEFKSRYAKLSPTRRMLNDDEIVGPVDFLVDERSSSVTGHTLVADGGWSLW